MSKRIAILGSTGSIGRQALDVVAAHRDNFSVEVLTAQNNADLLIKQALDFEPNAVVIANADHYNKVKEALKDTYTKVFAGRSSLLDIVEMSDIDLVLVALVGFAGLEPTYRALLANKPVALANKETLVAGGSLIMPLAAQRSLPILPVDSEHSAIFQSLAGERLNPIEEITLTASGGPFFGQTKKDLQQIKPQQALNHPNWSMGNKVTIDSATLMNKGFEMIEAKWLFGVNPDQIKVKVHPQSIVHSLVHFTDGSIKAQLSLPDMRLPIQYAMAYPQRLSTDYPRFSFADYPSLTFFEPDQETFRCLHLAYLAMQRGGNMPCAVNAANEIAVEAFLKQQIAFLEISEVVEHVMGKIEVLSEPSLDNFLNTDTLGRIIAKEFIDKITKK